MRRILYAVCTAALLAAPPSAWAAAKTAPSADTVIVDLLFGRCLAEATGTPVAADSIDPRVVGHPVDPKARDLRLSPRAVRVPTATGAVYFDHHAKACEIFASDLDAVRATRQVQEALDGLDSPVTFLALTVPPAGETGDRTISYAFEPLALEPSIPNLTISYPVAQPTTLAARISLDRPINLTSDSAPDWRPTDDQVQAVMDAARGFLTLMDQGRSEDAYALLADGLKQQQTLADFAEALSQFNAKAGAVRARAIAAITWTKDPPQASSPGVYAAVDLVSRFANIDRDCGLIVLYQAPGGSGWVVTRREEGVHAAATSAAGASGQCQSDPG